MREISIDEDEIQAFVSQFLSAFENLDMPAFSACFSDEATVFFPSPEPPFRVIGRSAVQRQFEHVFAGIRKSAASGPPYHRLDPHDVLIQALDLKTAIVSFHLINAERTARRTLVLVKSQGNWRILHLHASNAPASPTPSSAV